MIIESQYSLNIITKRLIMKQPVNSTSQYCAEPGSFNFTSRLEFEAKSNLLRSRSDTCLGKHRCPTDSVSEPPNPWSIPTIDFTLHDYGPKYSRFQTKKSKHHSKKQRNKDFVRIPIPKVLEEPMSKETPFFTSFRSPSARTAKITGVKEGKHPAGPYKALGPHAFRGDDFRPDSGIRNQGKPPFLTSYTRDPGNWDLQRKSIRAHAVSSCSDQNGSKINQERSKQSRTFTKQQPKWDHNLILTKEKYQRGLSDDQIRMNKILKQLSWYSGDAIPNVERPDINDYKTVDWLHVTQHSKDETTVLH